jgi:HAMP domain-containing protein
VRFFRSLQGKILLFFVLINITTVAVLIATVSGNAHEALETKLEDQLRLRARVASRSIDEQLALKWAFMKSLASNTFMVNSVIDLMGRGEYLEPFMQRLQLPGVGGDQTDVWLLDFAGHIITRNGKHTAHPEQSPRFSEEGWWPPVREGHPVAMVIVREGRSRLLLAFPVLYQQHTEGAVVAELDVDLLRELTARDGFEAALLAPLGPLFGTISAEALGQVRQVGPGTGRLPTFVLGDTFYLVEPMEGFMRERGLGWSLVLSVPVEHISGPVNELRQRMLGTGVIMAAMFSVLVVWGTRGLLRPLERMEDTMRRIFEQGDLSQRIRLESRDELGSIWSTTPASWRARGISSPCWPTSPRRHPAPSSCSTPRRASVSGTRPPSSSSAGAGRRSPRGRSWSASSPTACARGCTRCWRAPTRARPRRPSSA